MNDLERRLEQMRQGKKPQQTQALPAVTVVQPAPERPVGSGGSLESRLENMRSAGKVMGQMGTPAPLASTKVGASVRSEVRSLPLVAASKAAVSTGNTMGLMMGGTPREFLPATRGMDKFEVLPTPTGRDERERTRAESQQLRLAAERGPQAVADQQGRRNETLSRAAMGVAEQQRLELTAEKERRRRSREPVGEMAGLLKANEAWRLKLLRPYREAEARNDAIGRELAQVTGALRVLENMALRGNAPADLDRQRADLEARAQKLRGQYRDRVGLGLESIGGTLEAALPVVGDTFVQMDRNNSAYNADPEVRALERELSTLGGYLDWMERYRYPTRAEARATEEYQTKRARMEEIVRAMGEKKAAHDAPVPLDAPGMKALGEARQKGYEAVEGLSPGAQFVGSTALSIGQNAAILPTALLHPAAPLFVMGGVAAADKMYDVSASGKGPAEALVRGVASGAIEAVTEKIPLDSVMDMAKRGGRGAVRNMLRQAGVEATEEGVSYTLNYVADKLAQDENAAFSVEELVRSAASGGLSGLFFGAAGTVAGKAMGAVEAQGPGPLLTSQQAEEAQGQQKPASTGEAGAYRADLPENVELPTVPIINLSMEDVAALNRGVLPENGGYLRKTATERARQRLGLDQTGAAYIPASNVLRNGEEYVLKITKASLDKMFSPSDGSTVSPETVAVVENLERIANNGVYFQSEGDRKGRDQMLGVDHLMTTVYIDGTPYVVDMRVRILQEGERGNKQNVLYYLTPEAITTIKKADGGTSAAGRPASDGEAPPSSNTRIAPGDSGVKGQFAQEAITAYKKVDTSPPTGKRQALTMIQEEVSTSGPSIAHEIPGGNSQLAQEEGPRFQAGKQMELLPTAEELEQMKKEAALVKSGAEATVKAPQPILAGRHLVAGLVEEFSIPMGAKKVAAERIGAIARKMTEQGYVSDGDLEGLFDALYAAGRVQVEDGAEIEYRDIRQWLKGNRVYVPQEVKAEFGGDWNAFRAEAMGSGILLTNKAEARGIDSLYAELRDTFGAGIFPEEADASNMLRDMMEAARRGRAKFEGLEDAAYRQGGAKSAAGQREDMSLRLARLVEQFSDMAGLELRLKAKSAEDMSLMRERYQGQVKRQRDRVEQIQAQYKAVEENRRAQRKASADRLEALRTARRQDKEKSPLEIENVKALLADSGGVDMPAVMAYAGALTGRGVSYSKDLGRNLDAASGGDAKVRGWLRDLVERPVLGAKKNYANSVRGQLNSLKETMDDLGIKMGSAESAAVQRIGEGQYQDRYGKVQPYTLEMLKEEFPTKWENIQRAERAARETYDAYVDKINAALEEVYPNALEAAQKELVGLRERERWHKGQMDNQQTLCHAWEDKIAKLTQALEGQNISPEKRAAMEKSLDTAQRNLDAGLQQLDKYAARAEDADAKAQTLAARIDSGDVLRNKRLMKRRDYYHHFNEMAQGWAGLANILTTPTDINASLAGASDFTAPKSKWAGFLQRRLGGKYTEDAVGGLLRYIPQAEYKVHFDPIIAKNRGIIKALALETEDSRNANRFIEWMTDWTNDLAGKTNPLDRPIQKIVGRKTMSALKWLSSRAKSNAVLGNVRSAVAQVFNLPNAAAHIKHPKSWAKGSALYARQLGGNAEAKAVLDESGFLAERYMDGAMSQFDEGLLKVPEKFANWMLTVGDREATRLTWCVAFEDARRKRHADPAEYADDIARRSVGGRGVGEIPLAQKATLTQLMAPFQVEVNNTWQLMKEKAAAKDVVGLMLLFTVSALMNGVTRELFGFDVGIDPFHALAESIEDWEEDDPAGNALTTLGRVGGEFLSNRPYGAQLGQFLVPDDGDREKIFGDSDPSRFGTGNIGVNALADTALSVWEAVQEKDPSKLDLMTPLTTFVMPYGGRQLERGIDAGQTLGWLPRWTKDGLEQLPDAASYSAGGKLRFPVDEGNGLDVAKLFAFGPFSTTGGVEYSDNDRLPLSAEQTAAAENAARKGVDLMGYVPLVREMAQRDKNSEKRTVLAASELSDAQKAVVYYETIASDSDRELMDGLEQAGAPAGHVYAALDRIKRAGEGSGTAATNAKRDAIAESGLSDQQKIILYRACVSESRDEDIDAVLGTGLSFNDFLEAQNVYTDIGKQAGSAGDRATAFVRWMNGNLYTADQRESLREAFRFYSQVPAQETMYEKLMEAGLEDDAAYDAARGMAGLKPYLGKEQVSALQKSRVVVEGQGTDEQKLQALSAVLGESEYNKARTAYTYEVSPALYVEYREAVTWAAGEGSVTQAVTKRVLDGMLLTDSQKAALWQLQNTGWKPWRNPYSASVGQEVLGTYGLMPREGGDGLQLPPLIPQGQADGLGLPPLGGGGLEYLPRAGE